MLNKGTCFTHDEREALGLTGLLPPAVQSFEEQVARAYGNYLKAGDEVRRYLFLVGLQDRNETLFCRLRPRSSRRDGADHLHADGGEGVRAVQPHLPPRARRLHLAGRPRPHRERAPPGRVRREPRVIVITDNEAILGIGDQGVGGMPIAIGKLALYTVGAGIHPAQCLPLDLDVGTNNEARLADPLYLGVRKRRLRGAPYVALLDELVDGDRAGVPARARAVGGLRERQRVRGARALPATHPVVQRRHSGHRRGRGRGHPERAAPDGRPPRGRARRVLRRRRVGRGLGARRASRDARGRRRRRGSCADASSASTRKGSSSRTAPDWKARSARSAADPALVAGWRASEGDFFNLADVVRQFKPDVLVGASGQPGAFTEAIVRDLVAGCPRPIVLALSNPDTKTEVTPANLLRWTNGAAIIGTGSPFAPVEHAGRTHTIGQGNNAFIFPGVGLGATAVEARWLPDEAFVAAARALVNATATPSRAGDPIYPPLAALRQVSRDVAIAVGAALVDAGAAPQLSRAEIERRVTEGMWMPEYFPYRAASASSPAELIDATHHVTPSV